MSRVTLQITVWSIYRSTTNTYVDNSQTRGTTYPPVRPIREYIRYFAISGKSSAGTILLFELHPPLSRLHMKCWVRTVLLVARWT